MVIYLYSPTLLAGR